MACGCKLNSYLSLGNETITRVLRLHHGDHDQNQIAEDGQQLKRAGSQAGFAPTEYARARHTHPNTIKHHEYQDFFEHERFSLFLRNPSQSKRILPQKGQGGQTELPAIKLG